MWRRLTVALFAVLLMAAPAFAQTMTGPGGVIFASMSSVTITNSAVAAPLVTVTVPASYMQPFNNPGLHLRLLGTVSTAAGVGQVGNVNASCDWGGSSASGSPSGVASIAFLNGAIFPNSMSSVPIALDLYLMPMNPFDLSREQFMWLRIASSSTTNTSELAGDLASVTAVNAGVNNTLRCTWQWASANTSNSVTIYNAVLNVGP
jgi:hypothetical protein